jgi:heptosyltransferase III
VAPSTRPPRILVSRTDRIGDVVLTLPLCAMLREQLGAHVTVLGRGYTRPVLEACDVVNAIVEWDRVDPNPSARARAIAEIGADVILHTFPRPEIARAAREARIPVRIGTSHRWYHWLTCTKLEHYSRRRSALHEAQLNIRLARSLLGDELPTLANLCGRTMLRPRASLPDEVTSYLDPAKRNIALHPKSRGSGREWPLERWHELATSLDPARHRIFVTGSPDEAALLRDWLPTLPEHVVDLTGRLSLHELITFLGRIDGFVAAGTGPLHVAAAVGSHALGLFPPTPPIHPGRWAPIGPHAEWLAAAEPCESCRAGRERCTCMDAIEVASVRARIERWRSKGEA